jgi:hypothetical protein
LDFNIVHQGILFLQSIGAVLRTDLPLAARLSQSGKVGALKRLAAEIKAAKGPRNINDATVPCANISLGDAARAWPLDSVGLAETDLGEFFARRAEAEVRKVNKRAIELANARGAPIIRESSP